jgi:hypothetical protein
VLATAVKFYYSVYILLFFHKNLSSLFSPKY